MLGTFGRKKRIISWLSNNRQECLSLLRIILPNAVNHKLTYKVAVLSHHLDRKVGDIPFIVKHSSGGPGAQKMGKEKGTPP